MKHTKLGQHFLTRPEIARAIATTIPVPEGATVLEIGPGHGILTRELLMIAPRVVAIEKDHALVQELQDVFATDILSNKLSLVETDVRTFSPGDCDALGTPYTVVANIPYYITGYIIRKFLTDSSQPQSMTLLIQKEVAERIVARNGKHSLLSLSVQVYGQPKLEKVVKAGAFNPPPKVDSAILSITNISRRAFRDTDHENRFFALIKTAFSQKRKTLGATLKNMLTPEAYTHCGIEKTARPEDVPLETWLCLANS